MSNDYTYTNALEDNLWGLYGNNADDGEISQEHIVSFLNDSSSFRSFGDGLLAVVNKKYPEIEVTQDTVVSFIKDCCDKSGVRISDIASPNTMTNWFAKGMRPKKGETSRLAMFAFAFALGLNTEETEALFHKVYLDRAFNLRDEAEIIYYYCIQNHKKWDDATRLLQLIRSSDETYTDKTQYTSGIKTEVDQQENDEALLEYLRCHGHNFQKNSVKATEEFNRLLSQAKVAAVDEAERTSYDGSYKGKWYKGGEVSNNFLYELITGKSITAVKGTRTLFSNNVNLPKEIRNRFPEAATFGKKDMSPEERRKAIILLFSYNIWYQIQWNSIEYDLEDYVAQLNSLLFDCNYSGLYYGNPFDWLFLYCTLDSSPLDLFREILNEVIDEE